MAPKRLKGAGAFPKPVESPAPIPPSPTELYAALDLGTNSCRMLIAQPKGSQFHVVDSFSKSVQLGTGLEKTGRLSRSSMQRTIYALRVCQLKLKQHGVTRMRLVATEACRRAAQVHQACHQARCQRAKSQGSRPPPQDTSQKMAGAMPRNAVMSTNLTRDKHRASAPRASSTAHSATANLA